MTVTIDDALVEEAKEALESRLVNSYRDSRRNPRSWQGVADEA